MYVPLCFVRTYVVEHRTAFDRVIRSCFETLRDFYLEPALVITVVSYFSKISFSYFSFFVFVRNIKEYVLTSTLIPAKGNIFVAGTSVGEYL